VVTPKKNSDEGCSKSRTTRNGFFRRLSPAGICSFDVIEHIYDIPGFIRKCKLIPGKSLRLVFGSGANESNPVIKHKLQKGHLFFEFQDAGYLKSMTANQRMRGAH
jgi:hypothetical protein